MYLGRASTIPLEGKELEAVEAGSSCLGISDPRLLSSLTGDGALVEGAVNGAFLVGVGGRVGKGSLGFGLGFVTVEGVLDEAGSLLPVFFFFGLGGWGFGIEGLFFCGIGALFEN